MATQPHVASAIDPEIRLAIEALVHEHAWLIDHGRAGAVADLFTETARLLGLGSDMLGRAAIEAWARKRQAMTERRSRHVQTNIRLRAIDDGRIGGTVCLTLYRHDGPGPGSDVPILVGEYDDIYRCGADGRWRFEERRLTVLFGGD